MADPRQANRARALLAHDYQWCQHLTENPPTLTGARPKAMLDIVDMKRAGVGDECGGECVAG